MKQIEGTIHIASIYSWELTKQQQWRIKVLHNNNSNTKGKSPFEYITTWVCWFNLVFMSIWFDLHPCNENLSFLRSLTSRCCHHIINYSCFKLRLYLSNNIDHNMAQLFKKEELDSLEKDDFCTSREFGVSSFPRNIKQNKKYRNLLKVNGLTAHVKNIEKEITEHWSFLTHAYI